MSVPTDHPAHDRPSASRMVLWVLGAVVLPGSAALALAALAGDLPSAAAGLVASLLGAALGLLPVILGWSKPPFALALAQIMGSSVRMVVGVGLAVVAVLLGNLDPLWTLGVVLAAMLAALVAELVVIFPVLGGRGPLLTEAAG